MDFLSGEIREKCTPDSIIKTLKRPVVIVLIIGLLIRFILAPLLTHTYDIAHWAMVMDHIQAGFGLYSVPGYYYSPVWGYMLGTFSFISNFMFHMGPPAVFQSAFLPTQELWWPWFTSEITTISFNIFMKIPMILCDVLVGALIYYLIKERTNDEKKAAYGFALWFLCPIVIYTSSVQVMFDNFSILFMLLSVLLFYKRRYFAGGVMLSLAAFTKFFPAYIVFAIIAYVWITNKDDKAERTKALLYGAAGLAVMTLILNAPMIAEGSVMQSLEFISSRAESGYSMVLIMQPIIFALVAYWAYRLTKTDPKDADENYFFCLLLTTAAIFLWQPAAQYIMIIIPLLAYHIAVNDKRYLWPWLVLTASALIYSFVTTNFSGFSALASYTNIIDQGWVMGMMQWIQQPILGESLIFHFCYISSWVEWGGILLIIGIWFWDKCRGRSPI